MPGSGSRHTKDGGQTGAEQVTLAISVALLALLVGGLLWLELQRGDARPRITVTPHYDATYQHDERWYLPVSVRNDGDKATGTLRVALVRPIEGEEAEVADLEYVFVAGGEQVEGTAVFDEEPTEETIDVDIISVTAP